MFAAIGIGAKRDGAVISVRVQLVDNRAVPTKVIREQVFTGDTLPNIRATMQAQLQTMKDNENDAALNAAVAGVILASV